MKAQILERLNSAAQRKQILSIPKLLRESDCENDLSASRMIFEWFEKTSCSAQMQLLCSVVLEEEGRLQIASHTLTQILKITLNPHITVKELQMVSVFHSNHTLEDVFRSISQSAPKKSVLFKSNKKQHFQHLNPNNETHPPMSQEKASLTSQVQKQKNQTDESAKQKKLEKRTNRPLTQQPSMPTNYAQARLDLDKKVAKTQEKEIQRPKMTIESDEEYYEKAKFEKIMSIEGQKGKETDESGKKESESKGDFDLPQQKLHFDCHSEDQDEEDIFAKMNTVSPLVKEKIKVVPQKIGNSQSQKVKSGELQKKKIDHQEKKNSELQKKKNISTKSNNSKGSSLLGWLSQK